MFMHIPARAFSFAAWHRQQAGKAVHRPKIQRIQRSNVKDAETAVRHARNVELSASDFEIRKKIGKKQLAAGRGRYHDEPPGNASTTG